MSNHQHVSLLFYEIDTTTFQTRLIDILCYILTILGFIGNLLGLAVFSSSRRTRQISSTYVYLATSSSIINLFCVIHYVFILHSTLRTILREFVGQTWWGCKIYELSNSFRVISSWVTCLWMFERLMCVSKRLRSVCNRCNSYKLKCIIPILILIGILSCVIGLPVYMYQPQVVLDDEIMDSTSIDKNGRYCELSSNVSLAWKKYFHELRLGLNHFTLRCLFSELFPAGAIILFENYIIYHVLRVSRRSHRMNGPRPRKEQRRTILWMNLVLLLNSFLFLSSLLTHIIGHFTVDEAHEAWWVKLAVLINSSLNFYIYCLSGEAFRNEVRWFIKRLASRLLCRRQVRRH